MSAINVNSITGRTGTHGPVLTGVTTVTGGTLNTAALNVTGAASFSGNVSIAGTLSYDDVTDIDSVGIITAQSGINISGGDLTLPDSIIHAGDTNTKIRFPATDTFTVETAGSERLRITSGGSVGIGNTASSNIKLDVEGSLRAKAAAYAAPTNGTGLEIYYATGTLNDAPSGYLLSYDRDASAYKKINYDASDHKFRTSGTERLRIDSDGKLCVGINNAFGTENENVNIASSGGGRIALLRNDTSITSGNELGRITWYSNDSTSSTYQQCAAIRALASGTFGDGDKPTDLTFSTTPDNTSTPAERLRIDSSGRLLVGKTSTSNEHTLQVQAASGANAISIIGRSVDDQSEITFYENDNTTILAQYQQVAGYSVFRHRAGYLRFDSGGVTEKMRLDSSGRLLVSGQASLTSTSLNHRIQVAAASDAAAIAIIGRAADDIGELNFYEADKSTNLGEIQYRQDHANIRHRVGDIRFATGGVTERMRILSGGGITFNGDTTQANALDDYEEGTYTPYLMGSTGNPTYTVSTNRSQYVKIGRLVDVTIDMSINIGGQGSGDFFVTLPFIVENNASKSYSELTSHRNNSWFTEGEYRLGGYTLQNTNQGYPRYMTSSGGNESAITWVTHTNSGSVRIALRWMYYTAT